MDIHYFIKIFKESFDELSEDVKPSTRFKELESWTSMQALLFIANADDNLGFVFSADHIRGAQTIEDLYNIYIHQ